MRSDLSRNGRRKLRLARGFTIIELLIVVAILLLLTTFTAISIDIAFDTERVNSGARQVQSMISGARDRAIKARKPVGVRFLVDQDPDNGRMVSSMVYVGAADLWNRGNITLKRPDMEGFPSTMPPGNGVADADEVRIVDGEGTLWRVLYQRGFLGSYETDIDGNGWTANDPREDLNQNGIQDQVTPRIKIPGDKNGTWYRVRTHWLGLPNGGERLELVRPFRDSGTTPPDDVVAFEGTGHSTYLLELPPRVLPDAEPVVLPEGVVIDLDGSVVPVEWRPPASVSAMALGSDPYRQHKFPYSNRMDLMFSPRGTVTGSAAGLGMLHFLIARRVDIQRVIDTDVIGSRAAPAVGPLARQLVPGQRKTVNGIDQPLITSDHFVGEDDNGDGVLDPGEDRNSNNKLDTTAAGDRALVSVFASTGKVSSYPINTNDLNEDLNGNGTRDSNEPDYNRNGALDGPDGFLDDPFVYARLGEVNSQ